MEQVELFDDGEHQANDPIDRRVELHKKAMEIIDKAEQKASYVERRNDLFQNIKPGHNYPFNTFK